MIYQVLFVCLLGVQTAYGWNAVGRLSNLTKINLSNNPVYMGGHRHQLNCVGEKKLCDQYFGDPIDCESKGYNNGKVDWDCKYNSYKNWYIMLDQTKSIMTWETPENKTFDDEVYLNSFVLNYTLRFKGERLSQVQSITLKYGEMTTGYKPAQELNCTTPDLCRLYAPAKVVCQNMFNSTGNFQWSCEAELPTFLELGNLRIHCEKRRDADFEDEIVQDSCSLTYDLKPRRQSLTEISSLTFVAGKKTSGLEPINRLSCVEDKHFRNLCKLYELEQVTCHNLGTEQGRVQWKCVANLPSNVKLINPVVTCEKADNQENSNIVFDSCGLIYSLEAFV